MTSDEPDLTAAELALGLLENDERAAALRRLLSEPAFARDVEDWRERLGAMFGEWPEVAVAIDPVTRLVRTSGRVATPAERVAELWLIDADSVPRAAGLLVDASPIVFPRGLPIRPGIKAAVSIEPIGGSPKSTPTGPVVATGELVAI